MPTHSGHFNDARHRPISFATYASHILHLSSCRAQRGWIAQALYQVHYRVLHICTMPAHHYVPLQRYASSLGTAKIFILAKGNPGVVGDFANVTSQQMEEALQYMRLCETARRAREPRPPPPVACRVALNMLNQLNKAHGHMPHTAYSAKQARKRATALTRRFGE